jgi:hypothetical protein
MIPRQLGHYEIGDPTTIASQVGAFSISANGILAHRAAGGGQEARMT